jgi:hypothetical protein
MNAKALGVLSGVVLLALANGGFDVLLFVIALNQSGSSPALPGRQQKFDISGGRRPPLDSRSDGQA